MVAIATPNTEWRPQLPNFLNAIRQRVTRPGDEISGHHCEMSAKFVGHLHCAPYLRARHIATEMNIADLHDGQAIERGIQVGDGNLLATNLILKPLGRVAIHRAEERRGSGRSGSSTEKITPARIAEQFYARVAGQTSAGLRYRIGRLA